MVEDRVTDGRRIAQLLSSELTGLDRGPLEAVAVVAAERDVDPTPAGARAYDVAIDGAPIATVFVTPSSARVSFDRQRNLTLPERDDDLRIEAGESGPVLVVESGAAVKRAVDVLGETLASA